jgi:hypothetical protein
MEDANSALLSSFYDLALPHTTSADTAGYNDNGSLPSLFLNLSSLCRAGTSSPILTCSSGGSGPKSYDSKKAWYSSLSLFHVRNLLHD